MYKDGKVSNCKRYRYSLLRAWDETADKDTTCVFIGLHPTSIGVYHDSKKTLRYIELAQYWGYKGVLILNLFSFVAKNTTPFRKRKSVPGGVVGRFTNELLMQYTSSAPLVVAAWGKNGGIIDRDIRVLKMLRDQSGVEFKCVGIGKDGTPKNIMHASKMANLEDYNYPGQKGTPPTVSTS